MRYSIFIFVLLVSACANPFSQFYRGIPNARTHPSYIPSSEELKIFSTDNFEQDTNNLVRKGYFPIGESVFNANSDSVTEAQLREQANKIGAHVVLISSKFTHIISGVIPLSLPNTTTSSSTGSVTAFGPSGPVTAYGSGTTTTYGNQWTYIPYTVNRSDFKALYFAKSKVRVGLIVEPLSDEMRKQLGSNSGVYISIVVDGSPAFDADILPGDILISFGGKTVKSVEHGKELIENYKDKSVELIINRDGRSITKVIQLNAPPIAQP